MRLTRVRIRVQDVPDPEHPGGIIAKGCVEDVSTGVPLAGGTGKNPLAYRQFLTSVAESYEAMPIEDYTDQVRLYVESEKESAMEGVVPD